MFGAIGAHAIVSAEAATAVDAEDASPEGLAKEWEFVRRSQDIAMFLAKALDPTNPNHWQWPPGFEALEEKNATVTAGPLGAVAAQLLPALTSIGGPALTALLQSLVTKPAAAATGSLPPLGSAK